MYESVVFSRSLGNVEESEMSSLWSAYIVVFVWCLNKYDVSLFLHVKYDVGIMCSSMVTEIIEYYVSNNSSVYLLIDASKAFDRLRHKALF